MLKDRSYGERIQQKGKCNYQLSIKNFADHQKEFVSVIEISTNI
tara:strand:- start:551 stop:682 length:132 start_codon:yes stop_codon:yes gene_type:complete